MATRFYFERNNSIGTPFSAADAGWEQTGSIGRTWLLRANRISTLAGGTLAGNGFNIPITTTQDILALISTSEPIPPQRITGTVSLVIRASEDLATDNVNLAVVVKVVSQDGGTVRGTLFSVFGTDTEYALTASEATRIVNAQAVTALTTLPGDRLVVEIGSHATAPTTTGTFNIRYGFSAASDFALTSGLTTDLNPWVEFSQDIWAANLNNYQSVSSGNPASPNTGVMSVTEKIR